MIVASILTCFFLALLHHYIVRFGKKGRLIDHIPGPTTLPIIGNIHIFWSQSAEELWCLMRNYLNKYPICRYWIFTIPNVSITDPDDVEKILNNTKHNVKGYNYRLLHPWLGDGLLTSKGTKWQKRRKILTPAFHFSILKQFVEVLIKEGNNAAKSFNHIEETVIDDVLFFTGHHTLNAICETSMGISLEDFGPFQQKYRQTVHNIGKILIYRMFKPWLLSDIIFNITPTSILNRKYLNTLHSFTTKIIAERKRYHKQTEGRYLKHFENDVGTEDEEVIGIKKRRMAMLDILIAESRNSGLTDLDIREEVDTFVFEGHDTVAIAACFSLLLLAEHKDIQDRVRKEVNEVMEKNNGKLNMDALQNLSYLERCLKESLRIYPSVHYISRVCTEDVKLHSYLVPKGTTVHLFIYDLHHNANIWPNPEVFNPDRFLPENIRNRHPYSYLPFSAGPRNCIGQRFAMLELKALVAPLVYNFYLEPVDFLKDIPLTLDFVLRIARPIRMKIIPIKRT
ncbi:PREDICTED: cytochrome P450 4C1-like [Dinoponera quadriceps]|uniref:Cytochrome P450 4C1-like n=1 Tax=Dinoponera quadriceps TaxID=609295 RepID=A0A6P3YA71_DINQU|nr:PREDICTED: cytochrome P450 4C1-like [Dinoponera quadriceps]XP_014486913.1 PREDICTED: cytochrome P450 4C1-like [Dinoponera quadriceps]XP_014486914.1 PREDICTED: cytochrome P450 4C1-like [Dinoponera quadriceps]